MDEAINLVGCNAGDVILILSRRPAGISTQSALRQRCPPTKYLMRCGFVGEHRIAEGGISEQRGRVTDLQLRYAKKVSAE